MRILILGGTHFLGRYIAEAALAFGHDLTLFNRGQTGPGLFPECEHLRGDRDGDLRALAGNRWDAVIDTCGYVPRIVRASAEALADSVERYVFISTLAVYADLSRPIESEHESLATLPDTETEDVTGETYGALKVQCEQVVETVFRERALTLRPGFIVGPHDPTDRFTYWLRQVAGGGQIAVPEPSDAPVQFIDVRDLGRFTVERTAAGDTGYINVAGPARPVTWGGLLEDVARILGTRPNLVWLPDEFLNAQSVEEGSFPMFMPAEARGVMVTRCARALEAGLSFRPLADTVRDTLSWDRAQGERRAGLSPEREEELLTAWHDFTQGDVPPRSSR